MELPLECRYDQAIYPNMILIAYMNKQWYNHIPKYKKEDVVNKKPILKSVPMIFFAIFIPCALILGYTLSIFYQNEKKAEKKSYFKI